MSISKYQKEKTSKLKGKAAELYRQGLTLREVGRVIGKSYEWVREAVKEVDRT